MTALQPARLPELDALAALYAEAHGDTPELQAGRRQVLRDLGGELHAEGCTAGLREIRGAA